jgi:hypothetical protein
MMSTKTLVAIVCFACLSCFVLYQQTQIYALTTTIQSLNVTAASKKVNKAIALSTQLTASIQTANQILASDMQIIHSWNLSSIPATTAELNSVNDLAISANAFIDSFVVTIAVIFSAFAMLISLYHVNEHDANQKSATYIKDKNGQDLDQDAINELKFAIKNEQYLPPIILLPAVCAFVSCMSLFFYGSTFGDALESIQEIAEAFAVKNHNINVFC